MSDALARTPAAEEPEEPDTEEEFRTLFTDATAGNQRFLELATLADQSGQTEIAKVYREISGTVMSLLVDMAASSGGAFANVEDQLDDLLDRGAGDAPHESALLPDDAKQYIAYFEQIEKLLNNLLELVPSSSEGDQQREVFKALIRMTVDRREFTDEITLEEEEDEPEPEDDPPDSEDRLPS